MPLPLKFALVGAGFVFLIASVIVAFEATKEFEHWLEDRIGPLAVFVVVAMIAAISGAAVGLFAWLVIWLLG